MMEKKKEMAQRDIQINGTDYRAIFPPAGYQVTYTKIQGSNEGTMLNGAYTEDTIAIKAQVSSLLIPLTEEQLSEFLEDLYSNEYASVYYYDPRKGAYRTAVMQYETTTIKHCGTGADDNEYWNGLSVTFTDRFNWE